MNTTPSEYTEIIYRHYKNGMTISQIAALLGVARSTVCYHIKRHDRCAAAAVKEAKRKEAAAERHSFSLEMDIQDDLEHKISRRAITFMRMNGIFYVEDLVRLSDISIEQLEGKGFGQGTREEIRILRDAYKKALYEE